MADRYCMHNQLMNDFIDENFEGIRAPFTAGFELTAKCNSCENIRFCEHCVANFMLAYGDEEKVDPFFCRVAELRRSFVEDEIKRLAKGE